jgi:phosphoribosylaminoimidazolecarboxamide formyltransferase/IMP cyclohydrolase
VKTVRKALISVFYKDKLDLLAPYLAENGVEIISTGGTQKYLESKGIPVTPAEDLTTYPSILGGRVKTLHPAIFGGILNRDHVDSDKSELEEYNIPNIDLIWVDLYPFEETLEQSDDEQTIIEKIDIGGISLIRAAAKNYRDKLIISSAEQVEVVAEHMKTNNCSTSKAFRKEQASKAFRVSRSYDAAIGNYFEYGKLSALRYGENPHQTALFEGSLETCFDQIHGKQLSYNNLLDIDAAITLIRDFDGYAGSTFAILKHNNACGLANRETVKQAYVDALAGDPVSAFGGILITNSTIDKSTAEEMHSLFFEVVIAPAYDQDALEILQGKKNRIILRLKDFELPKKLARTLLNGTLIQDRDARIDPISDFKTVTLKTPSSQELDDLHFANILVKNTKSNAIVLSKNKQLLASGTGQTSRVDALQQAIHKARHFNFDLTGAVMASDAFFPFPDCVEIAGNAGISSVIQPGGSIKDQLSIDYCDNHGMSMVMTGHRHFKH